jgi:hypothetical protein
VLGSVLLLLGGQLQFNKDNQFKYVLQPALHKNPVMRRLSDTGGVDIVS